MLRSSLTTLGVILLGATALAQTGQFGPPFCIGFNNGNCPCVPGSNPGGGCGNESSTAGHDGSVLTASLATGTFPSVLDDGSNAAQVILSMTLAPPNKAALFIQGELKISPAMFFYDGLRCVDMNLIRLNGATPAGDIIDAGGSLTYPNLNHTESIVARCASAAVSQPIPPGATRYYFVHHRIDVTPNNCIMHLSGNGNTTNALEIRWGP